MNKIAVRSMVFAAIVAPTALLAQEAQPAQEAAPAGAVQAAADDLVADKGDEEIGEVASATVQAVAAEVKASVKGRELLADAFKVFADELGITYGEATADGRFYSKGQAVVDADAASPQFVKSRSMAYERAYLDAVARFMIDCYGRETTARVAEFYGNQSSDAEDSPVAKAKGLTEKIGLLAEAKVDKALAEEGVPAEKYASAGIVEKRTLLRDAIAIETANKALHQSSGCIPVKTFEARGDDGRYYIGVVVRYDRSSKTLAECFRRKVRPALVKEGGLTVKQALPPEDEIVSNFGVRLYFDETGTPALLSFGQFGSSYTGKSARMAERADDQALRQARMLADSGLTAFINSFVDASESSTVSEEITDSRIFTDDGNATPEEATRMLDIYRRSIKQTGTDTMKGRSTVFEKIVQHPNGHKVAVVVRSWRFGTLDAVSAIDAPPPKPSAKPAAPTIPREGAGVRKGRTYDF